MERVQTMNPFAKRESHSERSLLTYRLMTLFTWLLVTALSIYYSLHAPSKGRTIWSQNAKHPTPFSLNPYIISTYWSLLLLSQISYIYFLSVTFTPSIVTPAANVGSHFITSNILFSLTIPLICHSHFLLAESCLVLNFFNLTSLYFRHTKSPRFVHYPVVTGPLCFTFVALFWNGAVILGSWSLSIAGRILSEVFVWWWLLYGLFFVIAFKDYAMAWEMVVLSTALTLQQYQIHVAYLQWIFALIVTVLLLLVSLAFAVPPLFGRELVVFREVVNEEEVGGEGEERPLLNDE